MKCISVTVFIVWFLLILPFILCIVSFCVFPKVRYWAYCLLVGVDQFGNIILLGSYDETISSRGGRCIKQGGSRHWYINCLIWFIDWAAAKLGDRNHCVTSIESGNVSRFEIWNWVTGEVNLRDK